MKKNFLTTLFLVIVISIINFNVIQQIDLCITTGGIMFVICSLIVQSINDLIKHGTSKGAIWGLLQGFDAAILIESFTIAVIRVSWDTTQHVLLILTITSFIALIPLTKIGMDIEYSNRI